jgi:hypothetical protein
MYGAVKRLIARHDDSHDEIKQQARYAAWNEGDQKSDPKPERTNAEEFAQPAANARYYAISTRATQCMSLYVHPNLQII